MDRLVIGSDMANKPEPQEFEFKGGWLIIANKLCFPYDISVEEPTLAIVDSGGDKWVKVEEPEDSPLPATYFN